LARSVRADLEQAKHPAPSVGSRLLVGMCR
jgi:hypothetical protein